MIPLMKLQPVIFATFEGPPVVSVAGGCGRVVQTHECQKTHRVPYHLPQFEKPGVVSRAQFKAFKNQIRDSKNTSIL